MSIARLTSAAQRIAVAFHVGGASWTVTNPASGLGGTPTSGGTIAGYVTQGRLGQPAPSAPGAIVEPLKWYFTATAGGTLTKGQSITDGAYTFSVVGDAAAGMGVYEVARA